MMQLNHPSREAPCLKGLGVTLSVVLLLSGPVHAQQVLKDLDDPIRVELQTPVQGENAQSGQPFAAILDERVHYQNRTLPSGTVFRGQISKVAPSHRFGRPGYVVLQVEEAVLPSGQVFTFDSSQYDTRKKKLTHPDAQTFREILIRQIPYTVASVGTSVPLRTATDLNGGVVFAITAGARMVTGATLALFDNNLQDKNIPQRLAYGMWQGTVIPRAYQFISRQPEPDYQPGDEIRLYFDPEALQDLLTASGSAVQAE